MNTINQETWNNISRLDTKEKYELINELLSEPFLNDGWFPNITDRKNNCKVINQEIKEIKLLKKSLDYFITERKEQLEKEKMKIEKLREERK